MRTRILSAQEVSSRLASRAVVLCIFPLVVTILIASHIAFWKLIEQETKTRFDSTRIQLEQYVANGDTFQIRRLLSSINSDQDYIDIKVILPNNQPVISWKDISSPFEVALSNSDRDDKQLKPNLEYVFEFMGPGQEEASRIIFVMEFPYTSYVIVILSSLIVLVCLWYALSIVLNQLVSKLVNPISEFSSGLEIALRSKNPEEQLQHLNVESYLEFQNAIEKFKSLSRRIRHLEKETLALEKSRALGELASQVAHDIRSPLSALNAIIKTMDGATSDQKSILSSVSEKINKIATDLLDAAKRTKLDEQNNQGSNSLIRFDLVPVLKNTVLEKQLEYKDKHECLLKFDNRIVGTAEVNGHPVELSRIISNLINNSIEALPSETGEVLISLREVGKSFIIVVADNGHGIPEEILKNLGTRGFSYGKSGYNSGTGLGLFHAKSTIETWGGRFHIQSKIGLGTMITIDLPRCV